MLYRCGNSWKDCATCEPFPIETIKDLRAYEECYTFVVPVDEDEYEDEDEDEDEDEEDEEDA